MKRKKTAHQSDTLSIAERLRRDILVGVYQPGQWLKQADLEAAYDANQFEVRMAMHDLRTRGLLEHLPNKGYRVAQPSPRQRAETADIRVILETAALPSIAAAATAKDLAELRKLAKAFEAATLNGDQHEQRDLNYLFHRRLYTLCDNATLADLVNNLRENASPGPRAGWRTHAGLQASSTDHFDMLAALEKRDVRALRAIVERHIRRAASGHAGD
ncbi:MAG: GntR family transcriptional regulator [Burkholderiales bacterium]|nr:GntR family transcriptional regulator [Burkholderiales bacterium]